MEKITLVAGKDMPAGNKFAEGIASTGRSVMMTGIADESVVDLQNEDTTATGLSGVVSAEWNRGSSLSARTLILQTENTFEKMNETVLYFDEDYFSSLAGKTEVSECAQNSDNLILGFQYLALEAIARFEKKNSGGAVPGKLVFLLNEGPCVVDAVRSPALRGGAAVASPLVAAAAGAFVSFAENIAAVYGDCEYVNIVLVRGDHGMETGKNDDALAKWLGSYLDSVDGLKNKLTAKKSIQWTKPGAKNPGGFALFR